jgi:hypothetical protein
VAARRLGVPDVVAVVSTRARAWREEAAKRRAEQAAQAARVRAIAGEEQQRLRDAIVARRQRDAGTARDLSSAPLPFTPGPPPAALHARTAEPTPAAPTVSPPPAAPAAPTVRPLTAAERLALKRRERR